MFSNLLDEFGVKYWIDSGTLLGMKRDGELLKSDLDIDFGVFHSETEKIESLIRSVGDQVVVIQVNYGDWMYKWKLVFKGKDWREIDINVFKIDVDGNAVCPQRCSVRYTKPHLKNSTLNKLWRGSLFKVAKNKQKLDITDFPWSTVYGVWCWKVPSHYFLELEKDELYGLWRPKDWENYLSLKFGDWETPTSDWDFLIDDNTIDQSAPVA